jgi:hypothetical protein
LRKRKKARASSREKRDFCLNGSDENKLLRALKTTGKKKAEEEANKKKFSKSKTCDKLKCKLCKELFPSRLRRYPGSVPFEGDKNFKSA